MIDLLTLFLDKLIFLPWIQIGCYCMRSISIEFIEAILQIQIERTAHHDKNIIEFRWNRFLCDDLEEE